MLISVGAQVSLFKANLSGSLALSHVGQLLAVPTSASSKDRAAELRFNLSASQVHDRVPVAGGLVALPAIKHPC